MDELVKTIGSGKGLRRPSIAITFDDGYLDNYTLAYPVLEEYGVPVTLYLTTSVIGTMDRIWTDQVELALLKTGKEEFSLPALFGNKKLHIKTKKEKELINVRVSEALKLRPDNDRRDLLRGFLKTLEVDSYDSQSQRSRMMLNWDEVRIMVKDGITIGSHSHTHPILSRMPLQEAKEEIFKSKRVVEENLGGRVEHFSFPNGRKEDFSEVLRDYCRKIGFESVASVIYGKNHSSNGNALELKRIVATSPVWMLAGELVRLFIRKD